MKQTKVDERDEPLGKAPSIDQTQGFQEITLFPDTNDVATEHHTLLPLASTADTSPQGQVLQQPSRGCTAPGTFHSRFRHAVASCSQILHSVPRRKSCSDIDNGSHCLAHKHLEDDPEALDLPSHHTFDVDTAKTAPRRHQHWFHYKRWAVVLALALSAVAIIVGASIWYATATRHHGHEWSFAYLDQIIASDMLNSTPAAVTFFVLGDWGREGNNNQRTAAALMGAAAARLPPQFVISTGDNFYPSGLHARDDDAFTRSFTNVYSHSDLQVPWHAALGNHDYGDNLDKQWHLRGPLSCPPPSPSFSANSPCSDPVCCTSPMWQLVPANATRCDVGGDCLGTLAALDGRWHCERNYKLQLAGGMLDVFFIDTNPFIAKYQKASWAHLPDGLSSHPASEQQSWLLAELASSVAPWKLVVGHHALYSSGEHGNTAELQWMLPVLREYGVQLYLNGHDHHLEVIKRLDHPTFFATSGAGSNTRSPSPGPHSLHASDRPGFMAVQLRPDAATLLVFGSGTAVQPSFVTTVPLHPN